MSRALRGYAIAVVAVGAAAVLTAALRPYIADAISPLFFAAVVLACWSGGLRPGLLATALSALVTEAVFFPPVYRIDAGSLVRVFSFIVVAFLTASLYARARRAPAGRGARGRT